MPIKIVTQLLFFRFISNAVGKNKKEKRRILKKSFSIIWILLQK